MKLSRRPLGDVSLGAFLESFPQTLCIHLCVNVSSLLIRRKMMHSRRQRGWVFMSAKLAKESFFLFKKKEGDLRCACSAAHQTADESHHRERMVLFEVVAFERASHLGKVGMTCLVVIKPAMRM